MRRTAIKIAAAAALASGLGASTLTASPAQASPDDCPIGYVCVWEDSSYNGAIYVGGSATLAYTFWDDKTTSIWNRTNRTVDFFEHGDYTGYMFSFGPGHSSAAVQPHHNDRISSYRFQ